MSWKTSKTTSHIHGDSDSLTVKTFTPKVLMESLKHAGIFFPDIAWCQSAVETGLWKSKICRKNHNLFGMRPSEYRESTAISKRHGYASYSDWTSSVMDYKLWQRSHHVDSNTTRAQYIHLVKRVYASDPTYLKQVKGYLSRAKEIEKRVDLEQILKEKQLYWTDYKMIASTNYYQNRLMGR